MSALTSILSDDHQHCDTLFAKTENAVLQSAWPQADASFIDLRADLERHFRAEEDILFPAFEAQTGQTAGPTAVMRSEHAHMQSLLDGLAVALADQDKRAFLNCSETLLMLMRQHNLKEENILYPMAEHALSAQYEYLAPRLTDALN